LNTKIRTHEANEPLDSLEDVEYIDWEAQHSKMQQQRDALMQRLEHLEQAVASQDAEITGKRNSFQKVSSFFFLQC
jgi:hypothetical protein